MTATSKSSDVNIDDNTDSVYPEFDYSKLDFSKPITKDDLDSDLVNKKVNFCNKYLKGQISDPKLLKNMFNDITSFSNLFFKINTTNVDMFPYQDLIINDLHKYKIFRAARQIGKSLTLDLKASYNLIKDHGFSHCECIISKSLAQANEQMRRVKGLLNSMKNVSWKEDKSTDNTTLIIIDMKDSKGDIKYSNTLVVAPCTEGALGFSFHEVNLDEIEYWIDVDLNYFINQIIGPTILATDGAINMFSNPNGSDNYIAELENLKLPDGTNKYHTYVFDFFDRPGNTIEKFEIATAGLTRQEIESQYLAIRTLSSKNYFSSDEIHRSQSKELSELDMVGKQPFFFLDVGAKKDQSVLTGGYIEPDPEKKDSNGNPIIHFNVPILHAYPVGYPLSRVIGGIGDDNDGWNHEKSVKEYLEEWSSEGVNPYFGMDVTGNTGISPLCVMHGITPIDVTMSGPRKSGMYQRFKYLLEKSLFHIKRNKDYTFQMSHMEMRKSSRGYLMVHHETENHKDDIPDSCAGLIYLADNPDFVDYTITLI